jgi:cysteine synthase
MTENIYTGTGIRSSIQGLANLIGNTPLLEIDFLFKGKPRKIYAKAEYLNLTGSIKDRMAFHIMSEAYSKGLIKKGYRVIEATSGNTGISFSAIGRALGHPVTIFMPDWMSDERKNLIREAFRAVLPDLRRWQQRIQTPFFRASLRMKIT